MASPKSSAVFQEKEILLCVGKLVTGTPGVHSLSTGLTKNLWNKDSIQKGIRITDTGKGLTIDVYIKVEYGVKIPDVAWDLQEKIKKQVESVFHIPVLSSNIHVQGVAHRKKENLQKGKNNHAKTGS